MQPTKQIIIFLGVLAIFAFSGRFFPHLPNFTPVGALGLIASRALGPVKSSLLLIGVLLLSDVFIGFYSFPIMVTVYGSFVFYSLVGFFLGRNNLLQIVAGPLLGASFFFLTTNFAVWLFSPLYPQTLNGLFLSYLLAIPFFKNMLFGDLLFALIFSFSYLAFLNWQKIETMVKMVTKLRTSDFQNVNSATGETN